MNLSVLAGVVLGLLSGLCIADCGETSTDIETIQGRGAASPLAGKAVTIEATVSAVFQADNALNGFFVQQQDEDIAASHGLFVYSGIPVHSGERIRIRGKVKEHYGLTELSKVRLLDRCGQGRPFEAVTLPTTLTSIEREALEGVLVRVPARMISQNHQLVRYGQLQLAVDVFSSQADQRWLVDDPSSQVTPASIDYLGNLTGLNQLHLGSHVAPFEAIVSFGFGEYRLIPTEKLSVTQEDFSLPAKTQEGVRLSGVNLENLFNGNGRGDDFRSGRGPESQMQYQRKLNRVSEALVTLDADILVLNEVENDGFNEHSTVADLVDVLNRKAGADRYRPVRFTRQQTGESAIQNVILYNPQILVPVGDPQSIVSYTAWQDRWHRPFLFQQFEHVSSGKTVAVVAAHLKSKGRRCPGDTELSIQREGACSAQRVDAIRQLMDWLVFAGDDPVVLIGDLNAYPNESPIDLLERSGWRSAINFTRQYSYVFDGQPGILDYIFGNPAAARKMNHAGYWNINSGSLWEESPPGALGRLKSPELNGFSDHDPVFTDFVF